MFSFSQPAKKNPIRFIKNLELKYITELDVAFLTLNRPNSSKHISSGQSGYTFKIDKIATESKVEFDISSPDSGAFRFELYEGNELRQIFHDTFYTANESAVYSFVVK